VLFSNDLVANNVNRFFEPAWETVRPVPIVRIDFGNGNVLTRTLHGNIATYACTADGQVLDILPGIYQAPAYLEKLQQFRLLANFVDQQGPAKRDARLREYHEAQVQALKEQKVPPQFMNAAPPTKAIIESRIKAVLVANPQPAPAPRGEGAADVKLGNKEDVANWKELAEDTQINETVRRRQIHEHLAVKDSVRPEQVTKWLYKEVLHADLDDPYLGLGNVLFAGYPFAQEDKGR
jgi:hypothetical protein